MRRSDAILAVGALVTLGVTAALYAGHLDGPFFYDDHVSVVRNPRIERLWPPTWAWHQGENPLAARPLAALTLALDFSLHGRSPRGYRIANLLLHGANALLLLGVARRLLGRWPALRISEAEGAGLAVALALLWALHPLQTDAVVYVTQRTELLVAFFYLLTLQASLRGFEAGSRRARRGWFGVAALACALGALSKEVIATAPLLVLLADRAFVSSAFRTALRRHAGLYAGLAACWVIVLALLVTGPRAAAVSLGQDVSSLDYLRTQAGVVAEYVRLAVWPDGLRISHPLWTARSWSDVRPAGWLVAGGFAATLWALWRHPRPGFVGAWFFGILAPSSSFVPVVTEIAALRRMYLPLAALAGATVVGTFVALRAAGERAGRPGAGRRAAIGLGAAAALALGARTAERLPDFRSRVALWSADLRVDPGDPGAALNLAVALLEEGSAHEALDWLERGRASLARLDPDTRTAVLRVTSLDLIVAAYDGLGRPDRARDFLRELATAYPDHARVQHAYGRACLRAASPQQALGPLRRAAELDPGASGPWRDLADAELRLGRRPRAIAALDEAIRRAPEPERRGLQAQRDALARGAGPNP